MPFFKLNTKMTQNIYRFRGSSSGRAYLFSPNDKPISIVTGSDVRYARMSSYLIETDQFGVPLGLPGADEVEGKKTVTPLSYKKIEDKETRSRDAMTARRSINFSDKSVKKYPTVPPIEPETIDTSKVIIKTKKVSESSSKKDTEEKSSKKKVKIRRKLTNSKD